MKTGALRSLILIVLLKLALSIFSGHNYYVNIKMNWSEARDYCREKFTDLTSIANQTEDDALSDLPTDYASEYEGTWIGLYKDESNTWKWSGGENTSFLNWERNASTSASKKCAAYTKSGWCEENCEREHAFFCFQKPLLLVNENKTWEEALEHCRSRKMDLVSLVSESDLAQVLETSKAAQTDPIWTSLRYLADTWLWVDRVIDDQQSGSQNDMPQCPTWTQRCGVLSLKGGNVDSWDCADRLSFVCYSKGPSVAK